jgi:creatinine amidohydrolase
MDRGMSHMTQMEIAKSISEQKPVILPTGATEAHGPHMPTDTDTHQAEHIALR